MKTHDFTYPNETWGWALASWTPRDNGDGADVVGFGRGISAGDYLIVSAHAGQTTRYQVERIDYLLDPRDMWRARLKFAPRDTAQVEANSESSKAPALTFGRSRG